MQNKLKTVWRDLRQDEKTKVLLLPIPFVISVLTFGLCICFRKDKEDCDLVDVFFWPLDFLYANVKMLFNGCLKVGHALTAGIIFNLVFCFNFSIFSCSLGLFFEWRERTQNSCWSYDRLRNLASRSLWNQRPAGLLHSQFSSWENN